jgi:hypothetical protein
MSQTFTLAAGALAVAALSAAQADEPQISKFRYNHVPAEAILVCPATIAPADCNPHNALHAIVAPPWSSDVGCGVLSQQLLVGSGIRAHDGQYGKIVCPGETARADFPGM